MRKNCPKNIPESVEGIIRGKSTAWHDVMYLNSKLRACHFNRKCADEGIMP